MQTLTFVIGATASGKTHFIEQNYGDKDVDILNIYDYQQKAYEEAGYKDMIPFGADFRCLLRANETHLQDIIEKLKQGRNVVAEQTFFKAKRRIAYIDEIRKNVEAYIEIYVMRPSEPRWKEYVEKRDLGGKFEYYKQSLAEIEFPNPAEGFDAVYEVQQEAVKLRMEAPKPEILEEARKELAEEAARVKDEDEKAREKKEWLERMEYWPFWHYCEVCGKKELLTAQSAFDDGWDYPPKMGSFGVLGPRTCGNCSLTDTLYWKVTAENKAALPIVSDAMLTPKERVTWARIKAEPESLLEEEAYQWQDDIEGIIQYIDGMEGKEDDNIRLEDVRHEYSLSEFGEILKKEEERVQNLMDPDILQLGLAVERKVRELFKLESMPQMDEESAKTLKSIYEDKDKKTLDFSRDFCVINHLAALPKTTNHLLPMMMVDKNFDGTYRIYGRTTVAYPEFSQCLENAVERRIASGECFVLVADANCLLECAGDMEHALCGFRVLENSVEIFDRDAAVKMFGEALKEAYYSGKCETTSQTFLNGG